MEFNPKNLRKFFLEALEQTVMPRFDSIDEEMDSLRNDVKRIDKRLLDLEEKIFPEFAKIKEQFELVLQKIEFLEKSGDSKEVFNKINLLDKFVTKLKRELMFLTKRVEKFENNLKQLRQSQKRKTAK